MKTLNIDKTWTLFLDRDGVINRKIDGDYVRNWQQFEFLPKVLEALEILNNIFGKIIIVTNQRGIGRGLMTEKDLLDIHSNVLNILSDKKIKIDKIYYCPHDYEKEDCICRKPKIGMALQAKKDFPDIDFKKSIMVGDSISDIEFGNNASMISILIDESNSDIKSLYEFAILIKNKT
ncbi:D-glycero-alpha-D-manno-heptose-1,7-bisphosphate 7-phosphatase [Venenivibrio stagnispumantis]